MVSSFPFWYAIFFSFASRLWIRVISRLWAMRKLKLHILDSIFWTFRSLWMNLRFLFSLCFWKLSKTRLVICYVSAFVSYIIYLSCLYMLVWWIQLDQKLLKRYFSKHPQENLPEFVDKVPSRTSRKLYNFFLSMIICWSSYSFSFQHISQIVHYELWTFQQKKEGILFI